MAININDMNLPDYHPWFIPCEKSVDELIEEGTELAKVNWIAKSIFGYTILKNEDSSAILRDSRWHNAIKMFLKQNYDGDDIFYKQKTELLISLEGDEHARLRKLVAPYFTPSSTSSMRPTVRSTIESVIEEYSHLDSFDIQKNIFNIIPAYVLCDLLGIPRKDVDKFILWIDKLFLNVGLVSKELSVELKEIATSFIDYLDELITFKKNNLQNDLISDLIKAENDGDVLSKDEIIMLSRVLLSSGVDTGRSQLGLTFKFLLSNSQIWIEIGNNNDLLKVEVDRSFKLDGVIKNLGRFASEDIIYKGILFPKNTLVFPSLSVPNINEPDQQPLTFGRGIHYCLGSSLATIIVEETMQALSNRFPNIEISNDIRYKDSHRSSAGMVSMPVRINNSPD